MPLQVRRDERVLFSGQVPKIQTQVSRLVLGGRRVPPPPTFHLSFEAQALQLLPVTEKSISFHTFVGCTVFRSRFLFVNAAFGWAEAAVVVPFFCGGESC